MVRILRTKNDQNFLRNVVMLDKSDSGVTFELKSDSRVTLESLLDWAREKTLPGSRLVLQNLSTLRI